jgi:hypothetical protein
MPGNYDLSGTGSRIPEPDEADLRRADQGHREWVALKRQPPKKPPQLPPGVVATIESERLKHEVHLVDGLMAHWRAQDEAEVREYTKVWMRHLSRRADIEQAEALGPARESPSVNAFFECWRTFTRELFDSVVVALLTKGKSAQTTKAALDLGSRVVGEAVFGDGGCFDRLVRQTLYASFPAEAALAQYNGYRLYLFELEHTIGQTIELQRARWRGRRASQHTNPVPASTRQQRNPDPEAVKRLQKSPTVSLRTIADATGKTVDAVRKKLKREGVAGAGTGQSKRYPSNRVREIFSL